MIMDRSTRNNLQYNWRKINRDDSENLFLGFRDFADWSLENGYDYGMRLYMIDPDKGWSRDNCEWIDIEKGPEQPCRVMREMAKQWDKFIIPIRKRFAKELECIREGKPIITEPEPPEDQIGKVFFQYEHPDLIREGIIFVGGAK